MHNALLEAERLGFDTVQVFNKNQQQWKAKPLSNEAIAEWQSHLKRLKLRKTVSHDSYLINLGSPDDALWRKSIESYADEMQRCAALGIPLLVTHPGAHCGSGDEACLKRIASALDLLYEHVEQSEAVTTCLEVTAGQGSCVGHRLEHLATIIELVKRPDRLGVCLDTAHLFAAGYDFRGRKYEKFRKELASTIGLRRVKVLHLNDSKKDLGSRVDRHEHIGKGTIGLDGFKGFVRDEAFAKVPKIIETPKEKDPDGREWDAVNVEALRALMK